MLNFATIYVFIMFFALVLVITAIQVKKHGFVWPPCAIAAVIALIMLLQHAKTGGSFNIVYLGSVVCSACIIYMLISFVMRRIIKK